MIDPLLTEQFASSSLDTVSWTSVLFGNGPNCTVPALFIDWLFPWLSETVKLEAEPKSTTLASTKN